MQLPAPRPKPQRENTIALINIVFLMLIFFLIAGTLAPPMDGDVELIRAADARAVEPPRALFVTEAGVLKYEGNVVTPEGFVERKKAESFQGDQLISESSESGRGLKGPVIKIAADGKLPATKLVEIIDRLKTAGAGKIAVITERKSR
ncbi:ExbD/TolR family protein [Hoeflea prorocentri]|uniref:Biopolymer transporter ExbD n=1 Tax=Hoeflea prorocentri TaxID=1922333 RepID=A0A9X3UI88_9HYPH|nr:biopolymer transporter ExbD [Hoeflea prorocentri]MCY6379684.1 biopolymer transporter ExbD [Hoeflea prorocentri]MDA5397484.1 biopolymer transporter ExbD [Hoeflea prorocentri]